MVSYKLDKYDKYFVAFVLVVLTVVNILSVTGLCADIIPGTVLNGIGYNSSYETGEIVTLRSVDNAYGIYFPVKAGFSYVLTGDFLDTQYYRMFTTEIVPDVDVPAVGMYLGYTPNNYTFTATTDGYLFIWNYSRPITNDNTDFTTLGGMTDSVSSLVDNVGVNQLWNVFESGIDFVGVVVLVAFGLFLIVLLVKKLSKGKSDF